jgi:hypothetical protein
MLGQKTAISAQTEKTVTNVQTDLETTLTQAPKKSAHGARQVKTVERIFFARKKRKIQH